MAARASVIAMAHLSYGVIDLLDVFPLAAYSTGVVGVLSLDQNGCRGRVAQESNSAERENGEMWTGHVASVILVESALLLYRPRKEELDWIIVLGTSFDLRVG